MPLKPVIKTDDVKQPNVQVKMIPKIFEESNIEKPNFLSQLKLKHVSRPGEISSQNDSSVHSHSNKAPIVRRDLSPVNPIVTNNLPRRTPPSHKPPERKTLSNHTEQDSRPIPSPRPGEKKSFLHDYLEAHPEVSDQRLTSKLVPAFNLRLLHDCCFSLTQACWYFFSLVILFVLSIVVDLVEQTFIWKPFGVITKKNFFHMAKIESNSLWNCIVLEHKICLY